jgi:hypothetical protein
MEINAAEKLHRKEEWVLLSWLGDCTLKKEARQDLQMPRILLL